MTELSSYFKKIISKSTDASKVFEIEVIQNLWSGYGKIIRIGLEGSHYKSVVIKHVQLDQKGSHPRGWNTDLSHQRKLKSYQVESEWYRKWAAQCDQNCVIPKCLALEEVKGEVLIVLEDLDERGYSGRRKQVSFTEIESCLKWLANFHASFLGEKPDGLWDTGTYWHLDTRPDELKDLTDINLKKAAKKIDQILNESKYQTFVHGDAKLANFCFSEDGKKVAAVDFQYVGGGCGMKDVAYFIGSCLYENDCEKHEESLLKIYFNALKEAVSTKQPDINIASLEKEWRKLFPVAWTDFHRFIKGWSPGHWKINCYSEKMAKEVISQINTGEKWS